MNEASRIRQVAATRPDGTLEPLTVSLYLEQLKTTGPWIILESLKVTPVHRYAFTFREAEELRDSLTWILDSPPVARWQNERVMAARSEFGFGLIEEVKIVDTDNFGRDYPNETFFVDESMPLPVARAVVEKLNWSKNSTSERIYKIVPVNYVLEPGFEP
jgi:hypothetical protein